MTRAARASCPVYAAIMQQPFSTLYHVVRSQLPGNITPFFTYTGEDEPAATLRGESLDWYPQLDAMSPQGRAS